jgi:DNA-binding beta-propeller fold protein YncE
MSPSVIGEPSNGGGVFRFPQAIGVTPGGSTVFVGDEYSGMVQAFDRAGGAKFTIGYRATRREDGRLGVVGGVATDRSGHVYVLDSENDRVQAFDASDGHHLASFGDASVFDLVGGNAATGAGISAGGIAVSQPTADGAPVVFVADQGRDRVARFVLDQTTLMPTGPPQTSSPGLGLAAPQGLALDPAATRLYVADDDNHRIVVLDPVSLAQIAQFGSFGTGPGQFRNPYDVAVDSHEPPQLYVADNLNNRVDVFDAATSGFMATFGRTGYGPGAGNLEIVRAVGALTDAPGGGVDAADTANNRIQAFDAAGSITAAWGLPGRGPGYVTRPRGVAIGADGSLAVADSFDQRIELFGADGTYAGQRGQVSPFTGFATQGSNPGQYSLPAGVAYDAGGNLWVADTGNDRVSELDPSGTVIRTTTGFARPLAVATSADGTYVADTNHNRVVLIKPDGTSEPIGPAFAHPAALAIDPATGRAVVADDTSVRDVGTGTTMGGPDGAVWDHPAGLAFDAAGTLYVSERRPGTPDGARVLRRAAGGSWERIAGEGPGDGDVVEPGGLAVTPDGGTLYVADTGNNRVTRFDTPGRTPPATATLTVAIDQMARGSVVSDVPGIACVTDCRQRLSRGSRVTLTATVSPGSILAGWTGACAAAGAAPACTISMDGDQSAGAAFAPAPAPAPVVTTPRPVPPAPARIAAVHMGARVLHLARRADRRRHRPARRATRAKVTVTFTRPATLTVAVLAGRPGRRQGSSCLAPTRANHRGRPCTRFVPTARRRMIAASAAAAATFTLTPAFAGPPLTPGSYRLAITALDQQGNRVGPLTKPFRVVR